MSETGTLVLRRRVGETILIGDDPDRIAITVSELNGNEVVLAFKAPRNIPIDRLEIARQKERKNRQRT